jgi:hypothetical protein
MNRILIYKAGGTSSPWFKLGDIYSGVYEEGFNRESVINMVCEKYDCKFYAYNYRNEVLEPYVSEIGIRYYIETPESIWAVFKSEEQAVIFKLRYV